MESEDFLQLKKVYIDEIKRNILQEGHIVPTVTIFGLDSTKKDKNKKNSILHIPIPDEYLHTEPGKDKFIEEVLPKVIREIEKRWEPVAIAWSAELWMREVDLKKRPAPTTVEEMEAIPITADVLVISIESEHTKECNIYKVIHNEMSVAEDGSFNGGEVTLEVLKDISDQAGTFSGRFSKLFEKLSKRK